MGAECEIEPVTDGEIQIITEFVARARDVGHFTTASGAFGASFVALGLPAIHQRDRIQMVLEEMERRGLVERYDQRFDDLVGEPRYRELPAPTSEEDR